MSKLVKLVELTLGTKASMRLWEMMRKKERYNPTTAAINGSVARLCYVENLKRAAELEVKREENATLRKILEANKNQKT